MTTDKVPFPSRPSEYHDNRRIDDVEGDYNNKIGRPNGTDTRNIEEDIPLNHQDNKGIHAACRVVQAILEQITLHDSPPINEEVAMGKYPSSTKGNGATFANQPKRRSPTDSHVSTISTASGTFFTGDAPSSEHSRHSRQCHVPAWETQLSPHSSSNPYKYLDSTSTPGPFPTDSASVYSSDGMSTLSSKASASIGPHPNMDGIFPIVSSDMALMWMSQYDRSKTKEEMKMGNVALATLCSRTLDSIDNGRNELPSQGNSNTNTHSMEVTVTSREVLPNFPAKGRPVETTSREVTSVSSQSTTSKKPQLFVETKPQMPSSPSRTGKQTGSPSKVVRKLGMQSYAAPVSPVDHSKRMWLTRWKKKSPVSESTRKESTGPQPVLNSNQELRERHAQEPQERHAQEPQERHAQGRGKDVDAPNFSRSDMREVPTAIFASCDLPPTPIRGNHRGAKKTLDLAFEDDGVPFYSIKSEESKDPAYSPESLNSNSSRIDNVLSNRSPPSSKGRLTTGVNNMEEHEMLTGDEDSFDDQDAMLSRDVFFAPSASQDMEEIAEETEAEVADEKGDKEGLDQRGLTLKTEEYTSLDVGSTMQFNQVPENLVSGNVPQRLQLFGSEYARFLSSTPLAPVTLRSRDSKVKSTLRNSLPRKAAVSRQAYFHANPSSGFHVGGKKVHGHRSLNIEDASQATLSGAVTDILVTHGSDLPPKGYYRISQTGDGDEFTALRRAVSSNGASGLIPGRRTTEVFINVKKEPNWDRAAQRPCVTALAVIFPDRNEFVPPGFCVVRLYKASSASRGTTGEKVHSAGSASGSGSSAANLNFGSTGERVYVCYRRSRDGNPITGIIPLQPSNNETIPEGYTVIERTPRNHVADINSKAGPPVFLALRQRLASLEPLRPLPLVLSVHSFNPFGSRDDSGTEAEQGSFRSQLSRSRLRRRLCAYYCTGGTVVPSEVGRFHIMDRSTHSLLSPSSITNRLSLIEASRQRSGRKDVGSPKSPLSAYSSSNALTESDSLLLDKSIEHENGQFGSRSFNESFDLGVLAGADKAMMGNNLLDVSITSSRGYRLNHQSTPDNMNRQVTGDESSIAGSSNQDSATMRTVSSMSHGSIRDDEFSQSSYQAPTVSSARYSSNAANVTGQTLFSRNDAELQLCLDALSFIPTIETAGPTPAEDDIDGLTFLQARVASLTPILTSCYTHHGGSAMIAVEGLTKLLTTTDFFSVDRSLPLKADHKTSERLTLLDLATQVVCDVASCSARETIFGACVDFVQNAVRYAKGQLNTRTIGYVLRLYLFVFYFGASVPVPPSKGPCHVWNPDHREQRDPRGRRSIVAREDVPLLFEEIVTRSHNVAVPRYLPGGAPQAAALALKELLSLSVTRLRNLSTQELSSITESSTPRDNVATVDPGSFSCFIDGMVSSLVDGAVHRVDAANYTQLALHQIHRSGGSELFWYDMMSSCGLGLFGKGRDMPSESENVFIMSFALLANLIKVSSAKIRRISKDAELLPRDVSSKLLSLELLQHFLETWRTEHENFMCDHAGAAIKPMNQMKAVETMVFSIRRLVVPCLLSNTLSGLEDCRIFRRILAILSELCRSSIYRNRMKLEIGVLIEHFALRILQLGPQLLSPGRIAEMECRSSNEMAVPSELRTNGPPLLAQQIDLLFEIRRWFDSDPRVVVELFLNFDTHFSSHHSGPTQMLPGAMWKLIEKLCGSLCTIAEQSSDIICEQIRASQMSSTLPPPSPCASSSPLYIPAQSPTNSQSHQYGYGEESSEMALLREGSRYLQQSAFDAITQIVKCMVGSAALALGEPLQRLLSDWDDEVALSRSPSAATRNSTDLNDDPSISPSSSEENTPPNRAGQRIPRSWKNEHKRSQHRYPAEEESPSSFRHTTESPKRHTKGDDAILGYWQSAISSGRRKLPSSPKKLARRQATMPGSNDHTSDEGPDWSDAPNWETFLNISGSTAQEGLPPALSGYRQTDNQEGFPAAKDSLEVAFEIALSKNLKKAIDYLIACNYLTPSPRNIAAFLRVHCGMLEPAALGDYLSEGGVDGTDTEYWNLIRFSYVRAISFVGLNVEEGLRHFLTSGGFRLPGEAQRIDRMMSTFSQCYWEDNAGDHSRCPFRDQDTVYVISFAIIMLNTDLHKSHVTGSSNRRQQKRMTKPEFFNNLRGVDHSEELSREYLSAIYDSIEASPIALLSGSLEASSVGRADHETTNVKIDLNTSINAMLKNVRTSDELLRSLSVHDHSFHTTSEFCSGIGYDVKDGLIDLTQSAFATTWHHVHGLIHATLDVAHFDPRGLEMSLDLLRYSLCATICLKMSMERAAFMTQLARFKAFTDRRGDWLISQEQQGYRQEAWYANLDKACADLSNKNCLLSALSQLHMIMTNLRQSLRFDVKAKQEMTRVVRTIRDGEFLLNDPTRSFLQQGDLMKKGNRLGRNNKCHFFLFSDVLVYAKATSSGNEYKLHEELPLYQMKVIDWFPDKKQQLKTAFQVHHPRKVVLVFADSVEERQRWVKVLREAISNEVRRLAQLESARHAATSVER